jgi:hypothetical protein
VNRNRILHPSSGWQYITAPLQKHHRDSPIRDILVQDGRDWRDRLCGQLVHYKKRSQHYDATDSLVRECLDNDEPSLSRLNVSILARVCAYLRIPFRYEFFSEMKLDLGPIDDAGDWALRISEALGATEYVNPPGGEALFDPAEFEAAGVRLTIQRFENMTYSCDGYDFEPALSIIDVLMWNSPAAIVRYLAAPDVSKIPSNNPRMDGSQESRTGSTETT